MRSQGLPRLKGERPRLTGLPGGMCQLCETAGGSALREPFRLVLDLGAGLGERVGVLAAVVSAEQQLSPRGEDDTDVRLGTAAVTQIHGGQRLAGSHSTGHVAPPPCHRPEPGGCIPWVITWSSVLLIPNTRAGPYVPTPRPPTPRANGHLFRHARLPRHGILRIVPGNEGISGRGPPPRARP